MDNRTNLSGTGFLTREQGVDELTRSYLEAIDMDSPFVPTDAAEGLLRFTADGIREHNAAVPAEEGWAVPEALEARQVAALVMKFHSVCLLPWPGRDSTERMDCRFYVYQTCGLDKGLYTTDVLGVIESFVPEIGLFDEQDVEALLAGCAEVKARYDGDGFAVVDDGILNCRTGELVPFSPEYVFTRKSQYECGEWLASWKKTA